MDFSNKSQRSNNKDGKQSMILKLSNQLNHKRPALQKISPLTPTSISSEHQEPFETNSQQFSFLETDNKNMLKNQYKKILENDPSHFICLETDFNLLNKGSEQTRNIPSPTDLDIQSDSYVKQQNQDFNHKSNQFQNILNKDALVINLSSSRSHIKEKESEDHNNLNVDTNDENIIDGQHAISSNKNLTNNHNTSNNMHTKANASTLKPKLHKQKTKEIIEEIPKSVLEEQQDKPNQNQIVPLNTIHQKESKLVHDNGIPQLIPIIQKSVLMNHAKNKDLKNIIQNERRMTTSLKHQEDTLFSQNSLAHQNSSRKPKEKNKVGWNIMNRLRLVLKFMRALKRASNFHSLQNMKSMHYQIINDNSYSDQVRSGFFSTLFVINIIRFFQCLLKSIKVFPPDNIFLLLFNNVVILFFTLIFTFIEIVIICFDTDLHSSSYSALKQVGGIILLAEVLFRFNTAVYLEGSIVFNRFNILKFYTLHFKLLLNDLFVSLPILFPINSYPIQVLLFFLRWVKIYRHTSDLNDHFRIWYRLPTGSVLFKLLFMIVTLAHFFGCQFHYIGRLEFESDQQSWLVNEKLQYESWIVKYVSAFYFSAISIITIGYGDIVPITLIERVYVTCMAIIGSCVFSYIVNTIGQIFQEISNKEAAFKQQKDNISDYMTKRKVSQNLQLKVVKYLDYNNKKLSYGPLKGQTILNHVAKNLKEEVQLEFFGEILQSSPLFHMNFSLECLKAVSLKMKEVMYGPGEIIFSKGELDCRVFFIQSGDVALFLEKENNVTEQMAVLQKGQMFGQFGFFGQKPREASVKCLNITDLVYLELSEFLEVLQHFQEDFERYHMLKDEINFKDKKLNTKCSSCGSYDHTIVDCCFVKPQFNRFRIAIKYIYPVQQKRQALIRERFKFNPYFNNYVVRLDLKKVRTNLTMKFQSPDEIFEVSDEDEATDDGFEENTGNNHNDKEYFMKQRMQFILQDGEVIRIYSQASFNQNQQEQMQEAQQQQAQIQTDLLSQQSLLPQSSQQISLQNRRGGLLNKFRIAAQKTKQQNSEASNSLNDNTIKNTNSKLLKKIKNSNQSSFQQNLSSALQSMTSTNQQNERTEISNSNTINNYGSSRNISEKPNIISQPEKQVQQDKNYLLNDESASNNNNKNQKQKENQNFIFERMGSLEQQFLNNNKLNDQFLIKYSKSQMNGNSQKDPELQKSMIFAKSENGNEHSPPPPQMQLLKVQGSLDDIQQDFPNSLNKRPSFSPIDRGSILQPEGVIEFSTHKLFNNQINRQSTLLFNQNFDLLSKQQQLDSSSLSLKPQHIGGAFGNNYFNNINNNNNNNMFVNHVIEQQEQISQSKANEDEQLFWPDFDCMKEFKKYYPWLNSKVVIADSQRKRKPFVVNKSLHNNMFIQKIVNKKKSVPRRLLSFNRQFKKSTNNI